MSDKFNRTCKELENGEHESRFFQVNGEPKEFTALSYKGITGYYTLGFLPEIIVIEFKQFGINASSTIGESYSFADAKSICDEHNRDEFNKLIANIESWTEKVVVTSEKLLWETHPSGSAYAEGLIQGTYYRVTRNSNSIYTWRFVSDEEGVLCEGDSPFHERAKQLCETHYQAQRLLQMKSNRGN